MINITQILKDNDRKVIDYQEQKQLAKVLIKNIIVSKRNRNLDVYLVSDNVIPEELLEKIKKIIYKIYQRSGYKSI